MRRNCTARFWGAMFIGMLLGAQTVAAQDWSQPWAWVRIEKSPHILSVVWHFGRPRLKVECRLSPPNNPRARGVNLQVALHTAFVALDRAKARTFSGLVDPCAGQRNRLRAIR
jgi:hypothetical protein